MTLVQEVDPAIQRQGRDFFASIQNEKPSLFNKNAWVGRLLDWSMRNGEFKTNLFRFVDVFPYLKSSGSLTRHIQEYLGESDQTPGLIRFGAKSAKFLGPVGGVMLNKAIGYNIKSMATQFIIGEESRVAVRNAVKLRGEGFACVMDLLGESAVNRKEADEHLELYVSLLRDLGAAQYDWVGLGEGSVVDRDWNCAPRVQISVKPTALYWDLKPSDMEGSVENVLVRLKEVYREVIKVGGAMCIDMESYKYKNITIEAFKRLRSDAEFREYPHLGIVLQAYLKETEADARELVAWAEGEGLPIEVRLVKGAYWDFETVEAQKNGWVCPVFGQKHETDAAFERIAEILLRNYETVYFACGSHNIRSVSAVMAMARHLEVPETRYEFQVLYGMAEPVRKGILNIAGRVRLYCPYGEMIPGMAYLVRRLLENTANESFLRQSFVDDVGMEALLRNPSTL